MRATFDAAEALFKLMFPREPRLTAKAASTNLRALLQRMTDGNPPADAASAKALDSLCEWIEACQNYRHEQRFRVNVMEAECPSLRLSVSG